MIRKNVFNIKISDDKILIYALFFLSLLGSYIYFFPFDYIQVTSAAPLFVRALKDFTAIGLTFFFYKRVLHSVKIFYQYDKIGFLFFLILMTLTVLNYFRTDSFLYFQRVKNIAIFTPLALLITPKIFLFFGRKFHYVIFLQLPFFIASRLGFNPWKEGEFAGTFFSPNILAVVSLIYMIYLCLDLNQMTNFKKIILFSLALVFQIFSDTLGIFLITGGVLFLFFLFSIISRKNIMLICYFPIFSLGYFIANKYEVIDTRYMMGHVCGYVTTYSPFDKFKDQCNAPKQDSLSITQRSSKISVINEGSNKKNCKLINNLFGFCHSEYFNVDSQFMQFYANYGILFFLLFVFIILKAMYVRLKINTRYSWFSFFCLLSFFLSFVIYSSWDYFPIVIFFSHLLIYSNKKMLNSAEMTKW